MTEVDAFIEDFLAHGRSPEDVRRYNREYYLRNRKLKGRKAGRKAQVQPKKIHEDEAPEKSPSGAKMIDFDGKNGGRATYSDGSTYDGNGWNTGTKSNPKLRLNVAQLKLNRAKQQLRSIKDPVFRRQRAQRLAELQRALTKAKARHRTGAGNRGRA